eukprot:785731-Pelagomonas_calceolata.AAC.3
MVMLGLSCARPSIGSDCMHEASVTMKTNTHEYAHMYLNKLRLLLQASNGDARGKLHAPLCWLRLHINTGCATMKANTGILTTILTQTHAVPLTDILNHRNKRRQALMKPSKSNNFIEMKAQ